MTTLVTHNSKVKLPPNNWGEFFSNQKVVFPNPATRPIPSGHSTSWKSARTETHYWGNSTRRGTAFYTSIFPFPRGRSPERRPASLGERCPPRERESDKQTQEAGSGDKKYRVARTPLPVRVDIPCQDVSVPPDGSKGQRGNTYYLK